MAERVKFTKTFIDSLPLSSDKQIYYRDSNTIGFGLCVGKTKSYFAEKKMPNGKSKRKVIGKHGVYTLDQARSEAIKILLKMDEGIDPVDQKRLHRQSLKDEILAEKLIPTLDQAYMFYNIRKQLSKSSITSYDKCINDYFVDWKESKLNLITKKMIIDRHLELSKRSPAQANLAAKFLHALFNHTINRYKDENGLKILTIENPVSIIKEERALNKIKRRKTYIRTDQLHVWAKAIVTTTWVGEQNNDFRAYTNQDFLILLALTGFRRYEAETVEWENVDLTFGTISVKDTKNGEDLILPMGEILWHIMKERKKRANNLKYVFSDRKGISHISDRRDARFKVSEQSGITFTFHDLRRTFSSVANSLAIGSYTIKRLINHTIEDNMNDVTDGYVQVSFDDMRRAMNMIEQKILPNDVREVIFNRN